VLQDRIRNSLSNANSSGISQLNLTMNDFKGMIPEKVDLPADSGSVKRPTLTFDSKNGLMEVKTSEFVAGVPLLRHSPGPLGSFLTSKGTASVVAQPIVENGRLAMRIQSAETPILGPDNSKALAIKVADKALEPINRMLAEQGATVRDVKVVDGGLRITLEQKP